MRYKYESMVLSFSVEIEEIRTCCGLRNLGFMSVSKNATTSKAQRTREYRKAFYEILGELESYDDPFGMIMITDVTPDSWGATGAYASYNYQRREDINLYDFAVANKFKATKPCFNPNTDNEIVLFTKDINDARQ